MRAGRKTTRALLLVTLFSVTLLNLQPLVVQAQFDEAGFTGDSLTSPQSVNTAASRGATNNVVSCSWSPDTWDICLSNVIYGIFVGLGSILAYVGAYFFSLAVQLSLNSAAYSLTFISEGWGIARDIANMAFLFLLIYLAITIILRADTNGTTRTLAAIVVIALLVNFSFFFTRVVIDAGNILAVQFYNSVQVVGGQSIGNGNTKDLAAGIMGAVRIHEVFSTASFQQYVNQTNSATLSDQLARFIVLTFLYVAVGSMLWLLFIVFLRVGIQFLARIVVLWLVIIASPLAFVARALDSTKPWYDTWQDYLIKYSLYPVVFLFLFLILSRFATSITDGNSLIASALTPLGTGGGASENFVYTIAGAIGNIGIRLGFIVILLWLALKISDKLGGLGADAGQKFSGWATGAMLGGARFVGGKTGGLAYRYGVAGPAYEYGKRLEGTRFGQTGLGYRVGKAYEAIGKSTVLDTRSYADVQKMKDERTKDKRANLAKTEANKDAQRLAEINKNWEKDKGELEFLRKAGPGSISDQRKHDRLEALDTERAVLSKRVENMGNSEITALKAADIEGIVKQISEAHVKAIKESTKYSMKEVDSITKKWHSENEKAPMGKSYKELEKLDKIHTALKDLELPIASVAQRGPQKEGSVVITLKAAKDTLEEFENKRDEQQALKESKQGDERKEAQARINQLNKAIEKVKVVVENLEKVPEGTGGRTAPGEYEVKKLA